MKAKESNDSLPRDNWQAGSKETMEGTVKSNTTGKWKSKKGR